MKKDFEIPQIAILVSTSNSWGRRIVKGILAYANEVGPWHIWVQSGTNNQLKALPKGWRGDGIIARIDNKELAVQIQHLNLPVVNVADVEIEGFSAPCIRTDDETSSQLAVQHFIDRGLRSLAFVGPTFKSNAHWYSKAFKRNALEHGISSELFPMDENDPNLSASLTQWLQQLPHPVGVMAWGIGYGRQVVDCCMEAGISVPHDISVLSGGYDELLSHACFPSLSGVLAPTEQIGYQAARHLHEMIQGKQVPHTVTYLPPSGIMERMSTDTLAVSDPKLVKVVAYLKKHALEPITMTDILKAVPMARRSLERSFQQAFGRSPVDEIRRIRIDKVRKLLAETDMPMQEIAEACGYATYNYLTHVFKQTTGKTPRDYRKQFRT